VIFSEDNFKFLTSNSVWSWPHLVVFFQDFRVFDDPLELLKNTSVDKGLLSDHCIVLVVRVVGVSHLSIGSEFKLEELVTELALVADVVSDVEIVGTGHSLFLKTQKSVNTCFFFVSFSLSITPTVEKTKSTQILTFEKSKKRDEVIESISSAEQSFSLTISTHHLLIE